MAQSGYTDCACRDCFEIAITDHGEPALCNACEEAGCDVHGECNCEVDHSLDDEDDFFGTLEERLDRALRS
jgi:hypothetical protein